MGLFTKHHPSIFLILMLLLLSITKGKAQTNHRFSHLGVEKGLLSDQAFSIVEDNYGYIWIGTLGGIQRYDGYELVNYKFDASSRIYDPSFVRDIKLQGLDTIWFADRGNGVGSIVKGKLKKPILIADGLSSNNVECLLVDDENGLWIGSIDAGLNYLKDGKITVFRHNLENPASLSSDEVYSLMQDNKGNIWVGTTKGINLYLGNGKFKRFTHNSNDKKTLSHNFVHELHQDTKGIIWAGTVDGGLNKFIAKDSSFVSYQNDKNIAHSISGNVVLSIENAKDGGLWIGTWGGGLDYFDGEKFFSHKHNSQNNRTISSDYIEDLMTDSNGDIWTANYQGGINKYTNQKFSTYRSADFKEQGMIQSTITSMSESKNGGLWIATNNGINKFNGKNFEKYVKPTLELVSNDIHKILEDSQGRLWIGMIGSGRGLQMVVNGETEHFYNIENDTNSLSDDSIECIFEDAKKNIWIGTRNGLNLYQKGKFKRFKASLTGLNNELPDNQIRGICRAKENGIWIATYGGGLSLLKDGKFTNYANNPNDQNSLPNNNLLSVALDKKDNLWIATRTSIIHFNIKLNKFISYGKDDGINNEIIEDLVIDSHNNIWVATYGGLLLYNKISNKFDSFTVSDELAGNHIKTIVEGEKQIYIGDISGFSTIEKDSVKQKKQKGNFLYSRLEILTNNYKEIDDDLSEIDMITNQQVTLPYNINNFVIYYTLLNQEINPDNQYQYRVKNLTDEWISNGKSNKISFIGVPTGKYILEVKSQNIAKTIKIPIAILPPIWETNTAYFLYLLLTAFIFYSFYSFRIKKRKLALQLQFSEISRINDDKLNAEKMKFFTNASHELRTPLTLIIAPLQDLIAENLSEKVQKKLGFINQNSQKLLQLTNQLLDFRKVTSKKMSLQASRQDLVPFLKNNMLLFSDRANEHELIFKFDTSLATVMVFFDASKLETVITNLLSNAFKFHKGEITIELKKFGNLEIDSVFTSEELTLNYVEILVIDNGVGIQPEEIQLVFDRFYQSKNNTFGTIGSGIGLELSKNLVEMHRGTLSVTSIPSVKTTFSIKLPLGSAHLSAEEIVESTTILNENFIKTDTIFDIEDINLTDNKTNHTYKILIVEDNIDLLEYLSSTLSEFYIVVTSKSGNEGYAQCLENDFNLIISDVMMDDMDGIAFCKKVKSSPNTDYIPVILLTARTQEEQELEGLMAGANDYITKPFNIKTLRIKIDNLLKLQHNLNTSYNTIVTEKEVSDESNPLPENEYLKNIFTVIESNLGNEKFGVNELANELNMSRSGLYKKIKFLTGKPIIEVIMDVRLKKAISLLCNSNERISEIAYKVGFNNPKYFRICFKKQYGLAPKLYREKFLDKR